MARNVDRTSELARTGGRNDRLRLGGMALGNGLLVHGPTHWAAAVRTKDGRIEVASGRKPRVHATDGIPGVRGVVRLAEAMVVIPLVKRALPAARLPFQNAGTLVATAATMVAGTQVRKRARGAGGEVAVAVLGMAPALMTLRNGQVAEYHGVEHKAIKAYEQDTPDAADAEKEHERCGSHLVAPMLAANVAGTLLLKRAVATPGPMAGGAVSLASTALAVEVFAWAERHDGSVASRAIRAPGFALQRAIGTREPDAAQLEVGQAALAEILRVEA